MAHREVETTFVFTSIKGIGGKLRQKNAGILRIKGLMLLHEVRCNVKCCTIKFDIMHSMDYS